MPKAGKSRGLLILFLLLAVIAAGAFAFWRRGNEVPPELTSVPLSRGEVTQAVTATGDLQPVTTVDVSSQISGLIQQVMVDYNTPVTEGQVLAQIDPATYQQRLKQAQAEFASSQANATLVRLNTERVRELRTKNLVSQQELDQAEAQLAQAEAQLMTRQASVDDAKVNLDRCTIRAPIDGIVISRQAEIGKTVAASLNAPTLFTIVNDLTKMQINADVAEADIGSVEEGQVAQFTVDAYPGRPFRGRVSQIRNSPQTNQNVVTYETIIDVRNEDLKLKPGMTANVSIVIAQKADVLRLPNAALRVRVSDQASRYLLPPKELAPNGPSNASAGKALSDEERRNLRREIMREAGFTPGGGPPSPEVLQRARDIARQRGFDPELLRGGPSGGSAAAPAPVGQPITRTVYRLASTDPARPRLEAVQVKLGISDGVMTQVIEGLSEGDVLVTSFNVAGSSTGPAANPFTGRGPFGPPAGPRR